MGYCPFEYWLGWAQGACVARAQGRWARRGAGVGVAGRQAQALGSGRAGRMGRAGVCGARAWQERAGLALQAGWGAHGRACCWASWLCTRCTQPVFMPSLTRYFSGVRFLDIVREPGS